MATVLLMVFCLFVGIEGDCFPQNTFSEEQVTTEFAEGLAKYMCYREMAQKELDDAIEKFRNEHGREPIFRTLSREEQVLLGLEGKVTVKSIPDAMIPDHSVTISDYERINRWILESQEKSRLGNQETNQAWADYVKVPEDDNVQLQYTICMNRPGKYKLGEPIFISRCVKNLSDFWVLFTIVPSRSLFSTDRISLVDADGNDVPMTRSGRQEDECVKNGGKNTVFKEENILRPLLLPQNRSSQNEIGKELTSCPIVLNHYFDLSQPGVYHLTFHRLSIDTRKQLGEPLVSNTLTIEILDEFMNPEDLQNPGEFRYPPLENPEDEPEYPVE